MEQTHQQHAAVFKALCDPKRLAILELLRSGENGLVLEKSDPARWAKTLLDIAADPEKKARMEQAAYETVIHENTWDALADRFLAVYEKR